ncbi:COX assembly mitochondrial protein 2 homolog [Episyrphus balteatus]|uniref:COX assembly mitochondrial protein 2 homolog n=1 Tax=Episyrphus balteatus TaxID=286459 RepID=UPI0024860CEB|nr:COX assembly mitochondrial protein 2 homolog [Episyrphus balteatus]
MHTDLSAHLHTPECNKIINDLKDCHAQNTFGKFIGICNDLDNLLVKCLKQERINRSAANRAKAREQQKVIREKMQQPGNPYI